MADAAAPPPPATSSDPPPPAPDSEPLSRGYLSLRQAGAASEDENDGPDGPPPAPADSRCRAMMEVVRKDGADAEGTGRWKVSKLVADHNHALEAAAPASAAVPAVGMEFGSVHDAKGCYYGYGEAAGFKARTGSNRRSAATGAMIMQRFLCCRGNYSYKRGGKSKDLDAAKEVEYGAVGNDKGTAAAVPKKRGRKPGKKNTQVIEAEKGAVATACTENGQGVPSRRNLRSGRDKKDVDSAVELEEENGEVADVAQGGAEDARVSGADADDNGVENEMEKQAEVKEKRGRGRPRKSAVTEGSALQACASSDLGVTASQPANDERKKILDKYLSKRQTRPASGRPAKVKSHTACY
jgi:hypothetical protein